MSRTLELLADEKLHGTVNGYRAGCTGKLCPSDISCAEVYVRYSGDWGFRKAVDAGAHPATLIVEERENAKAQRLADIEANRAERKRAAQVARDAERRRKGITPRVKREPKPKREPRPTTAQTHGDRIRALHSEGISDTMIGALLGLSQTTVQYVRKQVLKLPANRQTAAGSLVKDRAERIRELHALGWTDDQIAADLNSSRSVVWKAREKLELERNPAPRPKGKPSQHLAVIPAMHADGLNDAQIGAKLGITKQHAAQLRRNLGLAVNGRPKKARVSKPRVLAPHGTNACWARGCRRDECVEAHRQYHRDYVAARRREGAREYHGTAYGYQLGCRGTGCPSTPSCTQAMLDADRARRRAAGVPAKELVDAKPMQAHVTDLVHAGMTIPQIADAAGLPVTVLRKMIHRRGAGRGRVETALAERVAAVLAVQIPEVAA